MEQAVDDETQLRMIRHAAGTQLQSLRGSLVSLGLSVVAMFTCEWLF